MKINSEYTLSGQHLSILKSEPLKSNYPMVTVHNKPFRVYLPETDIQQIVKRMAGEISRDYADKDPVLCPVLTGSYIFAADLTRYLDFDPEIRFVRYTSYEGMSSTGVVKPELPFSPKLRGRHVIIVEDIVDTGNCMEYMLHELRQIEPASIAVCTFFFKPASFQKDFHIDYLGKSIPNDFILGYGLDYDGLGRTYRDVYVLDT